MTLDMNVTTPWVKANGIGGIDQARWNTALDQIGLTFQFKDKAKAGRGLRVRLHAGGGRPQAGLTGQAPPPAGGGAPR